MALDEKRLGAGGSVLCTESILGVARTLTHAHVRRGGSGRLAGINGLHSRRDCRDTLESIVLMGFLSGTPALICIQPCAAHPRNSFLGKGIMIPPPSPRAFCSGGHADVFTEIVSRRKTVETVVRHTLRVCWSNSTTSLESGSNIFKYVFADFFKYCVDWPFCRT